MIGLAPRQQHLYDLLEGKGDVDITTLYRLYFGYKPAFGVRPQARLGPPISRLNRVIGRYGKAIVPGRIKGTYRLSST
jgi:hypothetical protein